jgi:hypothetical protein
MEPKGMKLPELGGAEFIQSTFIPKEWVIDPAFLRRIRDDFAIEIVRVRMDFLAKSAKAEAEMFESISKILVKAKG